MMSINTNTDVDYEKKVEALQEELQRKEEQLQELREKNKVLFKTALKNANTEVETNLKAKQSQPNQNKPSGVEEYDR